MNAALRRKYEVLRELLAAAATDEVRARYAVGQIIAEVKHCENKYGAAAVARLASALGRDAVSLYRYATVAERWSAPQMDALLGRKNLHGQPLSWSHWVFLASIRSPRARVELMELALSEGLSARELDRRALALDARGNGRGGRRLPGARVRAALARAIRATENVATDSSGWEEILGQLAALGGGSTPPRMRALLDRAIRAQMDLVKAGERRLERLKKERERMPSVDGDFARRPRSVLLAGGILGEANTRFSQR